MNIFLEARQLGIFIYIAKLIVYSGFSPSLAEVDPQTLSQGQAHLLNLVRDMVASLCSDSPESAYESLSAQARTMSQRRSKELLRVLRHSNESIPGAEMGSLLEMEDIFADELDRAVHEREAELEAEEVDLQNEPPAEDSLRKQRQIERERLLDLLDHEINGQRAYVRAFSKPVTKNGKVVEKRSYISSFVVGTDGRVRSYFYTHRSSAADNTRKGALIYKR